MSRAANPTKARGVAAKGNDVSGPESSGRENMHYTVDQWNAILKVRDVGIKEEQLSNDKILTVLHDNNNDVGLLASLFYESESGVRVMKDSTSLSADHLVDVPCLL